MKPEELLKLLKENGLEDAAILELLDGAKALLQPENEEEKDEQEVKEMFGL